MAVVIDIVLRAKDEAFYQRLHETLKAILPDTAAFDGAQSISCSTDRDSLTFYLHEV